MFREMCNNKWFGKNLCSIILLYNFNKIFFNFFLKKCLIHKYQHVFTVNVVQKWSWRERKRIFNTTGILMTKKCIVVVLWQFVYANKLLLAIIDGFKVFVCVTLRVGFKVMITVEIITLWAWNRSKKISENWVQVLCKLTSLFISKNIKFKNKFVFHVQNEAKKIYFLLTEARDWNGGTEKKIKYKIGGSWHNDKFKTNWEIITDSFFKLQMFNLP